MPGINTFSLPSPSGGWNARDALDAMPITDAVRLINLYPKGTSLEMRRGFAEWATGMTGTVKSLFETADPDGTRSLIAAANNKLWNITSTGTASEITGGTPTTTDIWQGVQYKGVLVLVNGATKPQKIDKVTRADLTYTGPTATTLIHPWVFKDRLYFVPVVSQSFWYGGVSAVEGALVEFDVGPFLTKGGYLLWGESGSKSTGNVTEDVVVLCSEKGEILIYAGNYPGGTFGLTNRFYVGQPIGRRSCFHVPGDLLIITEEGLVSVAALLAGQPTYDAAEKFTNEWQSLIDNYRDNFGWSGFYYPRRKQVIVNVPVSIYSAEVVGSAQDELTSTDDWWDMMVEWADYIAKPNDSYLDDTICLDVTVSNATPAVVTFETPGDAAYAYNGQAILLKTDGALPAGLTAETLYYVRNLSGAAFNVSATPAGALINTTDAGSGDHFFRITDWGYSASFIYSGTYYDGENNMYQIADHEEDTGTYYPYADICHLYYATTYVASAGGQVAGFNNFPHGLAERYIRQSDANAQTLLNSILENGAYVASDDDVVDDLLSRECAYALETHIEAVRADITLSAAQETRRDFLFECALGHIDQWTPVEYGGLGTADYFRPFMGGITARALISYYTNVDADSRIIPYLQRLAAYAWDSCWNATSGAFTYTDRETGSADPPDLVPTADLNMLIMPLYAWLWYQTGTTAYHDKASDIFEGAVPVYDGTDYVSGAALGSRSKAGPYGKIYNQQMYWGPDGVTWANSAPLGSGDSGGTPATTTKSQQVVQNYRTKAFCKFTGQNAACWLESDGKIYFGTDSGKVYRADYGQDDNDALIDIEYKSAFTTCAVPNQVKHFDSVRPLVRAVGDVQLDVGVDVEYRDDPLTGTVNLGLSAPPAWGSPWGTLWGGAKSLRSVWANTSGIGYAGAVKIKASVKNTEIELHGVQLRHKIGGEI